MAPPLWAIAVVLVFSIDVARGRYLLARAAPDDGDELVLVSSLGVAMWVFATSHLAGHLIADMVGSTGFEDRPWWRRRLAMAAVFVGLYGGFVVWVLAVTEAGAGRWAIAFVPLVAGSLVQAQRPDPAVWHWFGASVRARCLAVVASRRLRGCERAAGRFAVDLADARTFWLQQASLRRSVEGQWGLGEAVPSAKATTVELDRLDAIGIVPKPHEVEQLLARLAEHGIDHRSHRAGPLGEDDGAGHYSPDRWISDHDSTRRSLDAVDRFAGSRSN